MEMGINLLSSYQSGFHQALLYWFHWLEQKGYIGILVLMGFESSLIPIPSELILPPAAFWASQGRLLFSGVVLFGVLGSYLGSVINYGLARYWGPPFFKRFGKYFFLTESKVLFGIQWMNRFGFLGIFFARLLPGVRHVISIPAGLLKMNFLSFSIATLLGSTLWCYLLSWFGAKTLGQHPELLASPEKMIIVIKNQMHWFLIGFGLLAFLSLLTGWVYHRWNQELRKSA